MEKNSLFERSFFGSWYGKVLGILSMALVASALITFYATRLPMLQSVGTGPHLFTLLFTWLLMVPVVWVVAIVVCRLDRSAYFQRNELARWLLQAALLCVILPTVILYAVYFIYSRFLGANLWEHDYVNRDFVVVVFCVIMEQVFFEFRKNRIRIERLSEALATAGAREKSLLSRIELLEPKLANTKRDAVKLRAWLLELTQPIYVRLDGKEFVPVPVVRADSVYIDKVFAGQKMLQAGLPGGHVGEVREDSLQEIGSRFPFWMVKLKRSLLVPLMSIRAVGYASGVPYVQLFGDGRKVKVSASTLKDIKERITAYRNALGSDTPPGALDWLHTLLPDGSDDEDRS